MKFKKAKKKKDKLHIVYVMTWTGICGGSKIILQHCNFLVEAGHKVTILCHSPRPTWFSLDSRVEFIYISLNGILGEYLPKCDIVVATYWKEIYELVEQKIAPVVYFEQGDVHLFAPEMYNASLMEHIRKQIQIAPFVYTVSNFAKDNLFENFGVDAKVISNAVDKSIFFPRPEAIQNNEKITITTIGSDHIYFKCIPNILMAVEILRKKGYDIEFNWITPSTANKNVPAIVNPPQKEIGEILRRTDIYICASLFESFCLPVLEAMTCGAAVVTTDCGGIRDFVVNNENCLIIKKNDINDMVSKIETLIKDLELRTTITNNGFETAKKFNWETVTNNLIKFYQEIATFEAKN